ncbi:MAG TPA: ATP-binding cassette domain-containing protein [Nitrospiria bacterium]
MANAIEIENLARVFNGKRVVDGLSLEVREGEIFGLIGPNGAGKTTTIRMLLTLLKPTEGAVRVWGIDAATRPREVRQVIGYVPQEKAVDRYLTGREHLDMVSHLYHMSREESLKRIEEVLELVDLVKKADEVVGNYSGGMKKKLDIACGLIPNPKILILDEPTLGLDVESRIRIWNYIRVLSKGGLTIFLTTNYLDEAEQLCGRIAILDRGKLAVCGIPEDLKKGLGGDRVTLHFNPSENGLGDLADTLKKDLAFIHEIRVRSGDNEIEARVTAHEQAIAPLIQAVQKTGREIRGIYYSRPTLEDVFVSFTGRKIKEDRSLL